MIQSSDLVAKFQYALDNKWGYIWGAAGQLCTQAKQDSATRDMTVKYGQKWVGHYVADCSGLFTWAFKQLGGYMYHGSNTMFKKYCVATGELKKGQRTDGEKLKPGTAVFTGTKDDHGHVGLYIGGGWVIEAKGTQYGVVRSSIAESKWTWWGELKGVDYGTSKTGENGPIQASQPSVDKSHLPTLRRGDKGEKVREMQRLLIDRGYALPKYGADGDFGAETESAVKHFQRDWDLTQDGVCGEKTWERLLTTLDKPKHYTVTLTNLSKSEADDLVKKYNGTMKEMV